MNKILQIGEGNFLRAFAEDYIQKLNEQSSENYEVIICQPRSNTKVIHALREQGNTYHVYLRGRLGGKTVDNSETITCVARCIDTVGEYEELKKIACDEDLTAVLSNTTEAGIAFNGEDTLENAPMVSFPAKVTALLYKRFSAGLGGISFFPVELIENNGDALKSCVLQYAQLWQLGEAFEQYVQTSCSFCNTLVDRIVTGHPADDSDVCSVACEPYASWLIEADAVSRKRFPVDMLNAGAMFVEDINPYRERKVRILNGTHTMSVLAAYMAGVDIVRDMMNDALFAPYIDKGLAEIKSTMSLPKAELDSFAESVKERFNNPFIDHKLFDISLNSVAKFKARCLPTIMDYIAQNQQAPTVLSFSLAALIAFYGGVGTQREYTPNDAPDVLSFFATLQSKTAAETVKAVLANEAFWGEDLSAVTPLYEAVLTHFKCIAENGIVAAVKEAVNE